MASEDVAMSRINSRWRARTAATAAAVLYVLCFAVDPSLGAHDVSLAGEWPPLRNGVWALESTRVLPTGTEHQWRAKQTACHSAADLFMTYWGLGKLEQAGCRYYARKLSPTEYEVNSECMVRHHGRIDSRALIKLLNQDSYEEKVTLREGSNTYSARQIGRRVAECEPSPAGHAP